MAAPRAFISFDFDNNKNEKELFAGQAKNSRTPFEIEDWASKESLPQAQWEQLINEKIAKCHFAVVLVGRTSWSSLGVKKEIKMAQSNNVPFFGVYVDGAGELTSLPEGMQRNRIITWNWDDIANAINQMMGEGKNKRYGY
jgi:hypothetical protein